MIVISSYIVHLLHAAVYVSTKWSIIQMREA